MPASSKTPLLSKATHNAPTKSVNKLSRTTKKKLFKKTNNRNSKSTSSNNSTYVSNQQKFLQIGVLCVLVFLIMLSIISKISYMNPNYSSDWQSEMRIDISQLNNSDLFHQYSNMLGGNSSENLQQIFGDVLQQMQEGGVAAAATTTATADGSEDSPDEKVSNNFDEKPKDKKGLFSWLFSSSSKNSRGPAIQRDPSNPYDNTMVLGRDGENINMYEHHDIRLPEKPVASYKLTNPYRQMPSENYSPPMPQAFANYDQNDLNAMQYKMEQTRLMKLPNPKFVFHNKLPKCGTTTMHNIITILADWNNYTHLKVESARVQFSNERALVDIVKQAVDQAKGAPLLMMKHHFYFDFRPYGLEQPTYINVLRNPITWFESRYYFTQNGWKRNPGERKHDPMGDVGDMTVDECVIHKKEICVDVSWKYTRFFCGNNVVCKGKSLDERRRALMLSKKRLIEDFYIVGILEQFNDTLRVFEKIMPDWFNFDFEALGTDFTQEAIKRTKTENKIPMSQNARDYFANGPLKYDMDLYYFGRALFNRQMAALGLQSTYKYPKK